MPKHAPERLLDPDCRDGKHGSCVGEPCECSCHVIAAAKAEAAVWRDKLAEAIQRAHGPAPERPAEKCTACASDPCACQSDVRNALDALDDLLTTATGFDLISVGDLDAVDDWANNIQLDIARHRRLRKPCPVTSGRRDTTHTCDLGDGHEPIPHHCPRCNTEWRELDA